MLTIKKFYFLILFIPFFGLSQDADIDLGKKLFNTNCAACHKINKKAVGIFNVGTEVKSMYELAKKSNKNVKKFKYLF